MYTVCTLSHCLHKYVSVVQAYEYMFSLFRAIVYIYVDAIKYTYLVCMRIYAVYIVHANRLCVMRTVVMYTCVYVKD